MTAAKSEIKLVVAGYRGITDRALVFEQIELYIFELLLEGLTVTEIISGGCKGVDLLAETYAKEKKIPFHLEPALWDRYGPRAGPIRNSLMAQRGDRLLVIWNGTSSGTASMIRCMEKLGKEVKKVIV